MKKLLSLFLLLCACMQTWADEWTDSNGVKWTFKVNGTEATDIMIGSLEKYYIYGDPNNAEQQPVTLSPADAAAGRFSDTEGLYFPTISDDVYFGLKTLIFDIVDTEEGPFIWGGDDDIGCTVRVMNGWWASVYADNVPMSVGLWKLPITQDMANECAKGGKGRDLDLLMTRGSVTIKSVYYEALSEDVVIPENVVIPGKVYVGSKELTVTSIGDGAFSGYTGLMSVTIPEGVTSIGSSAFYGCSGLTSVTIPSSVKSIGSSAFYNCVGLTKVIVPDLRAWCNISFGNSFSNPLVNAHHLFSDENTEITDLVIPEGVTNIGDMLFYGCTGLTSVTFPSSVTRIGSVAFYGCTSVTKVIVPDIAAWCNISFGNGLSNPLVYAHHLFSDENTEITDLVIPEGVTRIGDWAFYYCSGLTSVTIPSGVVTIGSNAFYSCSGLTSVTIPENVTGIGDWAFYNCSGLTEVISLIEEPFVISSGVFSNWNYDTIEDVFTSATLYVPFGTKEKYEATPAWNRFQKIVESEVDGISTVQIDGNNEAPVYNLNGQRVNTPTKGIYIKDGKKVLMK